MTPRASTAGLRTHGSRLDAASAREGIGTFSEVLRPTVARYETLFSSPDRPEGIAASPTA